MIVGAGRCSVLAIGAREHIDENCHGGAYAVDEAARRHGACAEEETNDPRIAYSRFPEPQPTRYEKGWLPRG